jgi:hypothetical protein
MQQNADEILREYFTKEHLAPINSSTKNKLAAFINEVIHNNDLRTDYSSWVNMANLTIKTYANVRGGALNVHEFVRYFDMIRPQFSFIFWQTFHPQRPNNFLASLIDNVNTFQPAQQQGTAQYLTGLMEPPCPDNDRMIQLLWESWYLANYIDQRNGNSEKRQFFIDTLPNMGLEGMCGTGKPNNVFYVLHRNLLQEALELMG